MYLSPPFDQRAALHVKYYAVFCVAGICRYLAMPWKELRVPAPAQAIAAFDVEMRFKKPAAAADRERALAILDRLDDAK
ncbi:hypothetical protein ACSBPU_04330 [Parapusillimonas sp. JC17]|uniref:hypothetical protein n=1 Tax=Parapusillimonas sp. JC17 TaxID=3445768 RepID=UPI003FA1170E